MLDSEDGSQITATPHPRAALADEDPEDRWLGRVLAGRFTIREPLGAGGMAVVYRAQEQGRIRRDVAVKVLTPQSTLTPAILARFRNEAQVMAQIQHPNVVDIIDAGDDEGHPFLAMQLLTGRTLQDVINDRITQGERFDWSYIAPIVLQICSALAAAHRHGIVHRDIKPSNCFCIENEGEHPFVKVLDFGIAKVRVAAADDDSLATPLTQEGMFLGTPHYAAPEGFVARPDWPIDGRADLFAVGVIMYLMLTGKLPFQGEAKLSVLYKSSHERPPTPREREPRLAISDAIEALVMTAMARDPRERHASAGALAAAIRATLRDPRSAADNSRGGILVKGSITDLRPTPPPVAPDTSARQADGAPTLPPRRAVIVTTRPTDATPPLPGLPTAPAAPSTFAEPPPRPSAASHLRVLLLTFTVLFGVVALMVTVLVDRSDPAPISASPPPHDPPPLPRDAPAPREAPLDPPPPPIPAPIPEPVPPTILSPTPLSIEPAPTPSPTPRVANLEAPRRRQIRERVSALGVGKEILACLPYTVIPDDGVIDQIALNVTVDGNGATTATARANGVKRRIATSADACILQLVTSQKFAPYPITVSTPVVMNLD